MRTQNRPAHWTPDQVSSNSWIVGNYLIIRNALLKSIIISRDGDVRAVIPFSDIHRISGITAPEAGVTPNAPVDRSCLGLDDHEIAISD